MEWTAFILSFKLAFVTTIILLVMALPLARLLAFSNFRGKTVLESIVSLPLLLPPSVLGFYFLILFHSTHFIGKWMLKIFGLRLIFSFEGLVFASVVYSLPFMVSPIQTGLQNLPKTLSEMSFSLGKNKFQTFVKVLLPNIKISLLSAVALTFAHVIGEFGVVLMLGGSIPNETKLASIAIFDEVEALNYDTAHEYAGVLLAFSFAILLLINSLKKVTNWNFTFRKKNKSKLFFSQNEVFKSTEVINLDFRKNYPFQEVNFKLKCKTNQIIGLTGASGTGKTSILKAMAGLNPFSEGKLIWGETLWNKNEKIRQKAPQRNLGLVLQEYALFPHLTVLENLCFSLKASKEFYDQLIKKLALQSILHQYPHTLSGGQQQRVAIGRALLSNPNFLLLDEPFSALDQRLKNQVIEFLMERHKITNVGMLIISHEVDLLKKICDKIYTINQDELSSEISEEPLKYKFS